VKYLDIGFIEDRFEICGQSFPVLDERKAVFKFFHTGFDSDLACDLAARLTAYAVSYRHAKTVAYHLISITVFVHVPDRTFV
jgi:hypothetical protein